MPNDQPRQRKDVTKAAPNPTTTRKPLVQLKPKPKPIVLFAEKKKYLPRTRRASTHTVNITGRRLRDPVTVIELAQTLKIGYQVAMRLVKFGKIKGSHVEDGHYGGRYYVERSEIARVRREKPWKPWAKREFRGPGRPPRR